MATDTATSAACAATGARIAMSHRIPMESPPLAAGAIAVSAGSTAWSFLANQTGAVFGAIDAASLLSLGGTVLAIIFGGLIPKSLDAWQSYRDRRRVIVKADREADTAYSLQLQALQADLAAALERNAELLGVIKEMLEGGTDAILHKIDHVNGNVRQSKDIGKLVAEAIEKKVDKSLEHISQATDSVNRKVSRVEKALSGSGVDIPPNDSDPDVPTLTPPPGTKLPPEVVE